MSRCGRGFTTTLLAAAAFGAATLAMASMAHADDLSIPIDTTVEGGVEVGAEVPLATVASGDLDGARCSVSSNRRPGPLPESNEGNNLIVRSGNDETTLVDVEASNTTSGGRITLGPTISVVLEMGSDRRFAAAMTIDLDCVAPATTTASGSGDGVSQLAAADQSELGGDPATSTTAPMMLVATGAETVYGSLAAAVLIIAGATLVWVARRPTTTP